MTTNFFSHIASLNLNGTLKLAITLTGDGQVTVSDIFTAACGDKALNLIAPLTQSGTSAELDEAFFDKITEPVQKVAGLITNMESHLKSVETARLASQMEKSKKSAAEKTDTAAKKENDHELPEQKAEKKKAYEQAIKQIGNLKGQCKYEEAIALLPEESAYPEKAADLQKLRTELQNHLEQLQKVRLF